MTERRTHTVEKIGGTSMSRLNELRDTLFLGGREGPDLYGRVFGVSAVGGITDLSPALSVAQETGRIVFGVYRHGDYNLYRTDDPAPVPTLQEVERRHIARVLELNDGNRSRSARALGISRAALYDKMDRFGLRDVGR